ENLGQGFMVFDKHGIIQPGCSKAAINFFDKDPTLKTFSNIMNFDFDQEQSFDSWLRNVWKEKIPFKELSHLAPRSFEINNSFIELEYRPIYKEQSSKKVLDKVICISSDKTQEKELQEVAKNERAQVEMVLKILKDKNGFKNMIGEVKKNIKNIQNEFLESQEKINLKNIFRIMHTSKGAFSSFSMKELTNLAHSFEDEIIQLEKENIDINSQDEIYEKLKVNIVNLEKKLEKFINENEILLGEVNSLEEEDTSNSKKIKEIYKFMKENLGEGSPAYKKFIESCVLKKISSCFNRFIPIVEELQQKLLKVIDLNIEESEIKVYTEAYEDLIWSFIHIFRNAADHGIESPQERLEKEKPSIGHINIKFKQIGNDKLQIIFQDDGRGVSPKKIKAKALSKDIISEEKADNLPDHQILQLIFHDQFSSQDETTEFSGRGVGLSAVMAEAKKLGGTVLVASREGLATTFMINVPLIRSPKD
ncbi:MAG: ATP-binding protein, partial [Bdellovibrionota bacterium]|nr:ATP-binding protein [Bdellovibrionota bacterium]